MHIHERRDKYSAFAVYQALLYDVADIQRNGNASSSFASQHDGHSRHQILSLNQLLLL